MKSNEYIAGFFDADGCITISAGSGSKGSPKISVSQCGARGKELLQELRERFGGSVYPMTHRSSAHRQAYQWTVSGRKMLEFLELIRPLLFLKAGQADWVIKKGEWPPYTLTPVESKEFFDLKNAEKA